MATKSVRLNFGVIGAGGIALRKTIPGLLRAPNCRLVAVMNPSRAEAIARRFGVPRFYERDVDLLADSEVQAVYIASPVVFHARQIRLAARAGKHILCEKPLTLNPRQTALAVAECRRHRVILQEAYMMKFHGAHRRLKEIIDAGKLGRIVYLRAQLSCWHPPIANGWRQDPRSGGGGALIDMATHLYDLLEYFAGPIARLTALTGHLVHPYRSEDSSTTLIEFQSGAQATVDCFFCIPDDACPTRLEVYGSQGAVLTEGTIGQGSRGRMKGIFGLGDTPYDPTQNKDVAARFRSIPFPAVNTYTAECEDFAANVLGSRAPDLNGPATSLRIARLTAAAYAAARTGRMIRVAP